VSVKKLQKYFRKKKNRPRVGVTEPVIERMAKNGDTTMLDMTMKTKYSTAKKGQYFVCVFKRVSVCVCVCVRERERERECL